MSDHSAPPPGEKPGFFDRKGVISVLWLILLGGCAASAVAGFFFPNPHPHFPTPEEWKIFNALYGFVCFAGIVLIGQHLRKLVMRDEDYYDR